MSRECRPLPHPAADLGGTPRHSGFAHEEFSYCVSEGSPWSFLPHFSALYRHITHMLACAPTQTQPHAQGQAYARAIAHNRSQSPYFQKLIRGPWLISAFTLPSSRYELQTSALVLCWLCPYQRVQRRLDAPKEGCPSKAKRRNELWSLKAPCSPRPRPTARSASSSPPCRTRMRSSRTRGPPEKPRRIQPWCLGG